MLCHILTVEGQIVFGVCSSIVQARRSKLAVQVVFIFELDRLVAIDENKPTAWSAALVRVVLTCLCLQIGSHTISHLNIE